MSKYAKCLAMQHSTSRTHIEAANEHQRVQNMRHEKVQAKRDKKMMERDCHRNTLNSDSIAMENANCIPNVVARHVNSTVL
jgi:hypothetical protein